MSGFDVSADKKGETITVQNGNLLGEVKRRADVKELVKVGGFPCLVEVSFESPIDNPKDYFDNALAPAEKFEADILDQFEQMIAELTKLKEAEAKGDSKAADKADKLVKKYSKEFKSQAGDFGMLVRKGIEKALKKDGKKQGKAMTSSRTVCREIELRPEAFEGSVEDEDDKQLDTSVAGYIKSVTKLADIVEDGVKEEEKLRTALSSAISAASSKIAKEAGSGELDLEDYSKKNPKVASSVEDAADEYFGHLEYLSRSLSKLEKPIGKLEAEVAKDEKLAKNANLTEAIGKAQEGCSELEGAVAECVSELESTCRDLFSGSFDHGKPMQKALTALKRQSSVANEGDQFSRAMAALKKVS